MKITKNKIIAAVVVIAALTAAYMWGGGYARRTGPVPSLPVQAYGQATPAPTDAAPEDASMEPESTPPAATDPAENVSATPPADLPETEETSVPATPEGTTVTPKPTLPPSGGKRLTAEEKQALAAAMGGDESSSGVEKGSVEYSRRQGMTIDRGTGKDKYLTEPVPEGKPVPVEPQNAVIKDTEYTCTLSVRCNTILDNMDYLDKEKVELVPEDGVIFPATEVTFYEGESVFNVLLREMKKNKIHMEFVNVLIYNSVYIEGINNLYEFDVGELSGWMYKVNDWFPNYGCSRYQLKDGDVVEWVYTCDLGRDVDGYYAIGGEE